MELRVSAGEVESRPDVTVVPVTLMQAGPCVITQIKTTDTDGYSAVQLGFLPTHKPLAKPQSGHLNDLPQASELREFRVEAPQDFKRGDAVEATVFQPGDTVQVTGISKGKGFAGVVKRHKFSGGPASHGHKDQQRMPGSSGPGGVQHVIKGRRMSGRMGNEQVTVKNLEVMEVRDNGILVLKGAVPGSRNSVLEIISA